MGESMRDLQHLEELSSTAALGLWADDVVLALDRAARGERTADDSRLLADAAAILDHARERTETPLSNPRSASALRTTDTALTAVSALAREGAGSDEKQL